MLWRMLLKLLRPKGQGPVTILLGPVNKNEIRYGILSDEIFRCEPCHPNDYSSGVVCHGTDK